MPEHITKQTGISDKASMLLLLLTISVLLLYSCHETDNPVLRDISFDGRTITEINLDNIPSEVREYKLSELFSDFQTIPLETRAECSIGNTQVHFSDNFIFVGTQNDPGAARLYRFSKNGTFLNEYGREGRGPGEHQGYAMQGVIPFEKDSLLLVNWQGNFDNAQSFNINGTYISEVVHPMILLQDIYYWSDDEWFSPGCCIGRPGYPRDSCKIIFYDDYGNISKIIPRLEYPDNNLDHYTPNGGLYSIYRYNNQWKAYLPGIDTIFKLEDKELVPTEILIRGKNGVPYNSSIAPEELNGKYRLRILAETDNNLVIQKLFMHDVKADNYKPGRWSISCTTELQLIIIDKNSRKVACVKLTDDVFQLLADDFLNSRLHWTNSPIVYASVQAIDYLKTINESQQAEELTKEALRHRERLKGVTENSNPIILTFTLKDRIRIE